MAKKAHELLADALESASTAAVDNILQSRFIKEKQLTRLKKEGFLKPIIRGWYLLDADLNTPETGASVLWHESYWPFVEQYLGQHLGDAYVLSAEQSLDLQTGCNLLPTQLLIGNTKKLNRIVQLPGELSLSLFTAVSLPEKLKKYEGVNIYPLESALIKVGPAYFRRQPQEIALALHSANPTELLAALLEDAHIVAAGRLSGAFRACNMPSLANEILSAMRAAGLSVTETNPFDAPQPDLTQLRPQSPYAARIVLLWEALSREISSLLEKNLNPALRKAITPPKDIEAAIVTMEETYTHDAYHSLSIEGYRVTPELIEHVRSGQWNPGDNEIDKKNLDALAARGYWEAHNQVKESIRQLHTQGLSAAALRGDIAQWYRALFGPMVRVGMLNAVDLAGHRNRPVFIKGSRHTPLPVEAIMDAMETLFECAQGEQHPVTCAILCHWLIGYIHPFPDGNGRSARFLMNALLVTAGYPWTIIRLETRPQYMEALEQLSTQQNPDAFVEVILEAMAYEWP